MNWTHEGIAMESRNRRLFALVTACIVLLAGVIVFFRNRETPTENERLAMDILPGYSFVFNGKTNVIERSGDVHAFRNQHSMMPYLNLTAEKFRIYHWSKEHPIEIKETETEVVLTWPSRAKLRGAKIYWGSPYLLEVVVDKTTMKIVSALRW